MQTAKEGRGSRQANPRRTSVWDMAILPQFEVTVGDVVVAVLAVVNVAVFSLAIAYGDWINYL